MNEVDLTTVGSSLPRIRSVRIHSGYEIIVEWDNCYHRPETDYVDLAPLLFRLKFYAPLRDNPELFSTVHIIDEGTAIAWGLDEIDMAATSVLNLAEQLMLVADFKKFMKRNDFTFDSVAAELGISRRLAAYYASGRSVPRYISLACEAIDRKLQKVKTGELENATSYTSTISATFRLSDSSRLKKAVANDYLQEVKIDWKMIA